MPKNLGAGGYASHLRPRTSSIASHIWISDEILSRTFDNFVHRNCRHGSNTPGPLEARRRAAKRRITNTNRNQFGAQLDIPIYNASDPVGLFRENGANWWRARDNVTDMAGRSSWNWNPIGWWQSKSKESPQTEARKKEMVRNRENTGILEERLQTLTSCTQAIDLLQELSMSVAARPELSRIVLDCVLQSGWTKEEIAKFLLEPEFNPPGTSNHEYVIKHREVYPEIVNFLIESDVLVEATRLGLVSISGIRTFLSLVAQPDCTYRLIREDWARFCNNILDAAEQSKVLSLQDLGHGFLRSWASLIQERDFTAQVPQLLWRLNQSLSKHSPVHCLQLTVRASIAMTKLDKIALLRHLVEFLHTLPADLTTTTILAEVSSQILYVDKEVVSIAEGYTDRALRDHLIQLLSGKVPEYREKIRRRSDDDFIQLSHGRMRSIRRQQEVSLDKVLDLWDRESKALYLWYAVLAELGASDGKHQFVIDRAAFQRWVHNTTSDENAQLRCIGAMWACMALSHHSAESLVHVRFEDFERSISTVFFTFNEGKYQDAMAKILNALDKVDLPAKHKLLRRLQTFSRGLVSIKAPHEALSACLHDLEAGGLSCFNNTELHRIGSIHFPLAMTERAEDLNSNLTQFADLCLSLINEYDGMNQVVLRLLYHNSALKYAINYTMVKAKAKKMDDPVFCSVDEIDLKSPFTSEKSLSQLSSGGVDGANPSSFTYRHLVSMLDSIAWAFAKSQGLSNRSAWRYTYWTYEFVVSRWGLITPSMRRALWYAATNRPKVPTFQTIQFVHNLVRYAEGRSVADALLAEAEARFRVNQRHGQPAGSAEIEEDVKWGMSKENQLKRWRPF